MSTIALEGPWCSAISCTDPAAVVIRHPKHGQRTVCDDHAADYEVIRDV